MKKILLVALTLVLGMSAYAQMKNVNGICPKPGSLGNNPALIHKGAKSMPNWQPIVTDVTGVNFLDNTQTVSTQAIALSGKAMVIDFSATWCSWCWVMHQNGILEAIQNELGDDVQCIWVEADPSTDASGITGGTGSQGNWTLCYNTTNQVPYPIVDDANFANIIGGSSAIAGYPTVVFISPNGYWCPVYGEEWGFGPYDADEAVAAITNLLTMYPQENHAPVVSINGPTAATMNHAITLTAEVVSVDPINTYTWNVDGGNITANNNNSITVVWDTFGIKTVTCSVTNTGSDDSVRTGIGSIAINVLEPWNWGDTMTYCTSNEVESSIGMGGSGEIQWGMFIPSDYLEGRTYLTSVQSFINSVGEYELIISEGNEQGPTAVKYQHTYNVDITSDWFTYNIYDALTIDPTKGLWVMLHTNGVNYPATYTTFSGDYNGSYLVYQGAYRTIQDITEGAYDATWMVKAITSNNFTLSCGIDGPATAQGGNSVTFTAVGPTQATYSWSFDGGNPATASGATANTTFNTAGNHTITLTATMNGQTATASASIFVFVCEEYYNLPFNMGAEGGDGIECISLFDQDHDGYGWFRLSEGIGESSANYAHSGNDAIASASYINGLGALTPDNWIVLPKVRIPAGGAKISWWDKGMDGNYADEFYSVYVSTGDTPAQFNTLLWSGTSTGSWKQHTVNIEGYDNQDVAIAFRHHNVTDMYWLVIDDISVTAGTSTQGIDEANQANVAIFPNPASDMVTVSAEGLNSVEVFDMSGRVVLTTTSSSINMSQLANGVYMFRVMTENGISTMKVVKK